MHPSALPDDRRMIHVRQIRCVAYKRPDGLLDIEGTLVDTKPTGITLPGRGEVGPDEPVHEMSLQLTIDQNLTICEASAEIVNSPFSTCHAIDGRYRQLAGVQIGPGFLQTVKQLFRGTAGCSHLTELLPLMATTVFQVLWDDPVRVAQEGSLSANEGRHMPFDGCHALRRDGEIVKKYFPGHFQDDYKS